jgi:hypothetical protein
MGAPRVAWIEQPTIVSMDGNGQHVCIVIKDFLRAIACSNSVKRAPSQMQKKKKKKKISGAGGWW